MDHYPERTNDLARPIRKRWPPLPGYTGLYLSTAFRDLGMNLIGLFIPLYIYKLTGRIVDIFLFYALLHFWVVVFIYPVAWLVRKFGVDLASLGGSFFRTLFIAGLLLAESQLNLLWWVPLVWALAVNATWLPFHYSFTIAESEDEKYGKEVSRYQIVSKITALIGPAAGGLIITKLGFQPLYYFAAILSFVSALPLFFDTVQASGMNLSPRKICAHLVNPKRRKFWLSLIGTQIESVVLGLGWPLFIFLSVRNYETLGIIKSGVVLVSIVMVFFLGRWIDQRGKSVMFLGTAVNSFNLLLRAFLKLPFSLFLIDSAYEVVGNLIMTPFDTAFYEEAIKMRKLEFMVEREFVIHLTGVIFCLVIGLMVVLKLPWFWIFALGIGGILMRNYILDGEKNHG